jgi:hypothetical protein
MTNISAILGGYISEFKLNASDSYVYIARDPVFGDIVFSPNSSGIKMIKCKDISDRYFNKMYSVDVIKEKTIGYELDIGVLDTFDNIGVYNAIQQYNKAMSILKAISNDIYTSDNVSYVNSLNTDETFYNNVLIKKSADGAGKFFIDNRPMYIAPTMLPGTKSTELDAELYYRTGSDYFTVKFITHKKAHDVSTFMRFLNI